MDYGMNIEYIAKNIGIKRAAELLGKAGFKFLDYTPDIKGNWKEEMFNALEAFEKNNLKVYQTHATTQRYSKEFNPKLHLKELHDVLEASQLMGAEYMVIHGDEFDFANLFSNQAALEFNYEHYAPIVEKAEKIGINIAFENVFEYGEVHFPDRPRYCSYAEQLVNLIDKFNSSKVCCCWDFGHASVTYAERQHEAIKMLGNRICCTHVHDNTWRKDLHIVPFMGDIDWKTCFSTLKKYCNVDVLSLEIVYGNVLESYAEEYVSMLYKVCTELDKF